MTALQQFPRFISIGQHCNTFSMGFSPSITNHLQMASPNEICLKSCSFPTTLALTYTLCLPFFLVLRWKISRKWLPSEHMPMLLNKHIHDTWPCCVDFWFINRFWDVDCSWYNHTLQLFYLFFRRYLSCITLCWKLWKYFV